MKKINIVWGSILLGLILIQTVVRITEKQNQIFQSRASELAGQIENLTGQLRTKDRELRDLQNIDQAVVNRQLGDELKALKSTLKLTIAEYDELINLRGDKKQFAILDKIFALTLDQLRQENYASASATLEVLKTEIKKEADKRAVAGVPAAGSSGTEVVQTDNGNFTVRVISADLSSTKVIVETASESDCRDNCPVLPLAELAKRAGAFAAINGPYFCPASYPSCAGKTNSFDTLMMNKNKHYFNSDNNVYSSVPAAIFSTTSRFVTQSSQWGRDTGVDSVIAGQPLLVFNGQSQFGGDGDPKKTGKGTRAFIGATDNKVYIGLVYNASVAEMANVVAKMGIKNAINLDSGGSIAMMQNGRYLAGPGRDLPFGIMLVRR